jgi:hypothetical protein
MSSVNVTRFGALDIDVARATRLALAVTAVPALIVLEDLHLRLGIAYTSMGVVPMAERPTCRWSRLMCELFPFAHDLDGARPVWSPDRRRVRRALARSDAAELRTLRRLVVAGACFLMGQELRILDQIELAGAVHRNRPRPFALVPTVARDQLFTVSRQARELLDHAEEDAYADLLLRPLRY